MVAGPPSPDPPPPGDAAPRPIDQRFGRSLRLTKALEFQRVLKRRATAADTTLTVFALPNNLTVSRLGLSISRRVGGAVVRNRWKRRVREAFRQHRGELPIGYDFVVMPRDVAAPLAAIVASLVRLAAQAARRKKRSP